VSKQEINLRRLSVARRVISGETYKSVGDDLGVRHSRIGQISSVGMRIARHFLDIECGKYQLISLTEARDNKKEWIAAIDKAILEIST